MKARNRRIILVAAMHGAAIIAGTVVASGLGPSVAAGAAYAANHCTRYAPVVSVDNNCTTMGTMNGAYQTPSFAWRDNNRIRMSADRWWELYLAYSGGGTTQYAAANSTGGSTGGASNAQTQAVCNVTFGPAVNGECDTGWHD